MRELAGRLAAISPEDGRAGREEARDLIRRLHEMNLRWNIPEVSRFLIRRQEELFYS